MEFNFYIKGFARQALFLNKLKYFLIGRCLMNKIEYKLILMFIFLVYFCKNMSAISVIVVNNSEN